MQFSKLKLKFTGVSISIAAYNVHLHSFYSLYLHFKKLKVKDELPRIMQNQEHALSYTRNNSFDYWIMNVLPTSFRFFRLFCANCKF